MVSNNDKFIESVVQVCDEAMNLSIAKAVNSRLGPDAVALPGNAEGVKQFLLKQQRAVVQSVLLTLFPRRILANEGVLSLSQNMEKFVTPTGIVILAGTDTGFGRSRNEDRVTVCSGAAVVTVEDGMGGQMDGQKAAQALAEGFFESPLDAKNAIATAQKKMLAAKVDENGGTCFAYGHVHLEDDGYWLDSQHAGDCEIFVQRAGGIVHQTKSHTHVQRLVDAGVINADQALYHDKRNIVMKAVYPNEVNPEISSPIHLQKGDRIFVASDGITEVVLPEEIIAKTHGLVLEGAFHCIAQITGDRMVNSDSILTATPSRNRTKKYADGYRSKPRKDNRALVIMEIP